MIWLKNNITHFLTRFFTSRINGCQLTLTPECSFHFPSIDPLGIPHCRNIEQEEERTGLLSGDIDLTLRINLYVNLPLNSCYQRDPTAWKKIYQYQNQSRKSNKKMYQIIRRLNTLFPCYRHKHNYSWNF